MSNRLGIAPNTWQPSEMEKISNIEIKTTAGVSFWQQQGQSILDASIAAGYPINYACRAARCCFCKAQIFSGKTIAYRKEKLPANLTDAGWILTCTRTAVSDVVIDVGELKQSTFVVQSPIPCSILLLASYSVLELSVKLLLPIAVNFGALEGHIVKLHSAQYVLKGEYVISSVDIPERAIELLITKQDVPQDWTFWISLAKKGDILTLSSPVSL